MFEDFVVSVVFWDCVRNVEFVVGWLDVEFVV